VIDLVWISLTHVLILAHGTNSALSLSLAGSKKSVFAVGVITAGFLIGWFWPPAVAISCLVSLIPWVVPDKRVEQQLRDHNKPTS